MILLHDRIEIDPERALPELDTAFAKAYVARPRGQAAEGELFALVGQSLLPVRTDLLQSARGLHHNAVMRVKDAGPVPWAPAGRVLYAFVYERPPGKRLAPLGQTTFPALGEADIVERLVRPLALGLTELSRLGLSHGAVRPDNLFVTATGAVLGDFLNMPAGFGQTAAFETIERGAAPVLGRGPSNGGDDLYALGVTLIAALTGEVPLKDLGDDAVVQLKMERGSYLALMGERRFPGLGDFLRGVLADDAKQRWNHAEIASWLEDRKRQAPKQAAGGTVKASRPLRFNNQEYWQPRQVAIALSADTKLGATLIKSEEVGRWIGHSLADENAEKFYEEAIAFTKRQRSGPEEERLVTNVAMMLDPKGPIRYRGVKAFPQGLALYLASLMIEEANTSIIAEMISNNLPLNWLAMQTDKRPDTVNAVQMLERARDTVEKGGLGNGIERAVYDLNPGLCCLAPALRGDYVLGGRALLDALNKRAPNVGAGGLMDRHVAGFILSRDRKVVATVFRAIDQAGNDAGKRGLALLTLFADMQYRLGPDSLPGIANALLPLTEETSKRFKNRSRQEQVRKNLRLAAGEGKLSQMLELIDDPDALAIDEQEYNAAQILYKETEKEAARLTVYAGDKRGLAEIAGQPLAAVIAVALAFAILLWVVIKTFWAM